MGSLANPATPIQELNTPDIPPIPTRLRAGDSWNWSAAFPAYSAALYTLQYIFNSDTNRFALAGAPISASADGQSFDIEAASADTAAIAPDTYSVAAILTGLAGTAAEGQQVTLLMGDVRVDANLAAATAPIDGRSFVKKTLDMIEAAIAGNTSPDVLEYEVPGQGGSRRIRRIEPGEMLKLRAEYSALYRAELRASGQYSRPRKIGFRF
jgi:hypothetical protein